MKRFSTFEKSYSPEIRKDGSILFETYGKDLDGVRKTHSQHIWTLLDCNGRLVIVAGYHLVNRMNYLITKNHWRDGTECFSY
jgi:hypothetical protein